MCIQEMPLETASSNFSTTLQAEYDYSVLSILSKNALVVTTFRSNIPEYY